MRLQIIFLQSVLCTCAIWLRPVPSARARRIGMHCTLAFCTPIPKTSFYGLSNEQMGIERV